MTATPPSPPTPPFSLPEGARCLKCGCFLKGLTHPVCPECGRAFEPLIESTYTLKPPLLLWKYWLPGTALAGCLMFILLLVNMLNGYIGWGTILGIPIAGGALMGYGLRDRVMVVTVLAIGALTCVTFGLIAMHPAAAICGAIFWLMALGPIFAGLIIGRILRAILKRRGKGQSMHLPVLLAILLPMGIKQVETRFFPPPEIEAVSTSLVLPLSSEDAYGHLMFYEQVRREPPWLLKLGLPRPVSAHGNARQIGDVTTCVYVNGRLMKRVTAAEPGKTLAFDVIEQTHVEDHAIKLVDGRFDFTPLGPEKTLVTLTTRYRPLLTPRFCWRWFEVKTVHTLHRFVMEGILLDADCNVTLVGQQQP